MGAIAYIIASEADCSWVKAHAPGEEMIAHDAVTHRQFPEASYFFPPSENEDESSRATQHLAFDWFRDDAGHDRFARDGISFAQVISGSAWIAIASYVREWLTLEKLFKNHDRIGVSVRESERFIRVAGSFGERVVWYDPGSGNSLVPTCPDRPLPRRGYPLHQLPKSRLARIISWPLRTIMPNRDTLYLHDWTYRIHAARDRSSRTLLGRNILIDAYAVVTSSNAVRAKSIYDTQFSRSVTTDDLAASLARIDVKWPLPMLQLVVGELRQRAQNLRDYLADCFAFFEDLLDTYKPKRVVVTGETYEPLTLLMQMCRKRGIRVYYALDGYITTMALGHPPLYRTIDGNDWLISDVLATGRVSAEHYAALGFPANRINQVDAAFLHTVPEDRSRDPKWDASIAAWVCNHLNPQARAEWSCVSVCDVAELLLAMGFLRIAVKVKQSTDIETYRELQRRGLLSRQVEIVGGTMQEHLLNTRMMVGGLSTGIVEAFNLNLPYYIYEPLENGYSDKSLESRALNPERIARTLAELRENILSKRQTVIRSREELLGGSKVMPWLSSDSGAAEMLPATVGNEPR